MLPSYPLPKVIQLSSAPGREMGIFPGDFASSAMDTPKQPSKTDFCSSLNSKRTGLSSIYFSFYPASKGSSICRQYLTLSDKLHLYRLIQTQAINTRRLCADCLHAPGVPLPGQTFQKAFGKILVRCPDHSGTRPEVCD